ncbi:MAG: 3-oxoacyl-ACP reductase [Propionibacteriaceae bacterium]|nr:3-oxoacyl-ACP reductase [Propionibacteriaceae bacterium]
MSGNRVRRTDQHSATDGPTDPYGQLVSTGFGKLVAKRLGLPRPVTLRRFSLTDPLCDEPVLVAAIDAGGAVSADGGFLPSLLDRLHHLQIEVEGPDETTQPSANHAPPQLGGLVLDLSALRDPKSLGAFREIAAPAVKRLLPNARVVLIGTDPRTLTDPTAVATQQALTGIIRSLGKELRAGATANLVFAAIETDPASVANATEFFLSGRSAYVSGQVLRIDASAPRAQDRARPLTGQVAVVTGAARGIGAAIVEVLARDGATVVGVDVPAAGESLAKVVNAVHGTALPLDITDPSAGQQILDHCLARHQRLDIVVHNAGITRDKLLVNMDDAKWDQVIDVNLSAMLAINAALLAPATGEGLTDGARILCLSSQNGIAGARGQTNYAASKAGVIGLVEATAPLIADRGITINAVAPGFIETEMTARMPLAPREIGRRLNSLQQGGQPADVAETLAFLAQPGSQAITGQVLRICGQSLIGA